MSTSYNSRPKRSCTLRKEPAQREEDTTTKKVKTQKRMPQPVKELSPQVTKAPSPRIPPKKAQTKIPATDDLDDAIRLFNGAKRDVEKLSIQAIHEFRREFKQTVDATKRETQRLDQERAIKKTAGTTRSGSRRGVVKQDVYTEGKWVNKGIDDSREQFDEAEKAYLKEQLEKFKKVKDLKFEHLKYLLMDVFLPELKSIKSGDRESKFHERYMELGGKSKSDLFAEVRTSLFTNEQRDYLNGLLQGAFDTITRDHNDDIKHSDIKYVEIVMLAEITIRVVKYVHKFDSNEQAFDFMVKSSREALGLSDDDQ